MKNFISILSVFLLVFVLGYMNGYEKAYDETCMSRFIDKMNEKAKELGMQNTHFADPSGLLYENIGTVDDVISLLDACVSNDIIMSIWNQDSSFISILDVKHKERIVLMRNTFLSDSIAPNSVLGRKTGSDGFIFNLAICLGNSSDWYSSYVILNASSEVERLTALKTMCDGCCFVSDRLSVCCKLSDGGRFCLNEQEKRPLLSITKLMTVLVALEYENNLNRIIEIKECDIMRGSSIEINAGECLSFYDAIKAMLISSSNTCSYAIAREVGYNITS